MAKFIAVASIIAGVAVIFFVVWCIGIYVEEYFVHRIKSEEGFLGMVEHEIRKRAKHDAKRKNKTEDQEHEH